MRLLAIETATEACSAALFVDGRVVQRHAVAPREHAALILSFCDAVLDEAGVNKTQLDAIAFGCGPGSFTGVRIAAGVAQGIGFALDLPLLPVSTLATLAQGAVREHGWQRVVAAIDARMGEIYWGTFSLNEAGIMRPMGPEAVGAPESIDVPRGEWCGVGTGWGSYGTSMAERMELRAQDWAALPQARDTVALAQAAWERGEAVAAEQATPVYLRDNVARKKG